MMRFELCIGIDYSGAEHSGAGLPGLQVFASDRDAAEPVSISASGYSVSGQRTLWTRESVARFLLERALSGPRFIAGIDHAFSFPLRYLESHGLTSWGRFLEDFRSHWPLDEDGCKVDDFREGRGTSARVLAPADRRTGSPDELRLCECWTASAKSVFLFDVQGSVAKSTHTGLPWLHRLRTDAGDALHFWPFDGWDVPDDKSVIAEVYPSLFRRRYFHGSNRDRSGLSPDQRDAYSVARWLAATQERGALPHYFHPPLTDAERRTAELEGWILGVC